MLPRKQESAIQKHSSCCHWIHAEGFIPYQILFHIVQRQMTKDWTYEIGDDEPCWDDLESGGSSSPVR
eukprot:1645509-Amphidinium_carterae.1